MQPPVVTMTDCSLFLCSFKQSKPAVRLKEDMKKIAAAPLNRQRGTARQKVFGVSLTELQQQGLNKNGIPTVVWDVVGYLTQHGKLLAGRFCFSGPIKLHTLTKSFMLLLVSWLLPENAGNCSVMNWRARLPSRKYSSQKVLERE